MILKTTKLIALLLFIFLIKQNVIAQTDSIYKPSPTMNQKLFKIKTVNGKVLIGNILDDNENGILLLTLEKKDKIRIPKYDIESMEEIDQNRLMNGVLKGESNFSSKYAFSTNSLPMKKGEAYFHTFYFLLYDIEYAVSDNVSIGAVTSFVGTPFLLSLKYKTEVAKDVYMGAGLLVGPFSIFEPSAGIVTMPNAAITFGGKRNNFSLMAGYPIASSGFSNNGQLVYTIGAMTGISRSLFFVFDSFFINLNNNFNYFVLPGLRVESAKSSNAWSFHLGATSSTKSSGRGDGLTPIPFPFVTYAHAFD